MNLDQVKAFLALSEEMHFGRTAERLYLSQSRVSRLVASFESEVGGALFERTSRRVRLTPLGSRLRDELLPGYHQIERAVENAQRAARQPFGLLRIGFTNTTEGPVLTRLVKAYEATNPNSEVSLHQVPLFEPYRNLRAGEVDVLVNWLAVDEPDLVAGPVIDHQDRVVVVSSSHPLAKQDTVSVEDVADWEVAAIPSDYPAALRDAIIPKTTPSGRTVRSRRLVHDAAEAWALVARGVIIHPGMSSMAEKLSRDDIVLVPIRDLPPMPLGLVWCRSHENARIHALAEIARSIPSEHRSADHDVLRNPSKAIA